MIEGRGLSGMAPLHAVGSVEANAIIALAGLIPFSLRRILRAENGGLGRSRRPRFRSSEFQRFAGFAETGIQRESALLSALSATSARASASRRTPAFPLLRKRHYDWVRVSMSISPISIHGPNQSLERTPPLRGGSAQFRR